MSADNRICVYNPEKDHKWYVWEGSASVQYYKAPDNAKMFESKEDAFKYAFTLEQNGYFEYGVSEISKDEVIESLRWEVRYLSDELKHPSYCPTCGACGETGCCPPSMCKHGFCLYGEHYSEDYLYMKDLVNAMWNRMEITDKENLHEIHDKVMEKYRALPHFKTFSNQLEFNI